MPSRVVLTCWGSYGDLFPYLGLAIRLKAAGFAPVVATCPYYRPLVEAEGIDFHPVRPDVDPTDTDLMARVMDPGRGSQVVINEMVMPFLRQSYDDLVPAIGGADLVVSHPVTFAARIAAEERQMKWLSTVLAPVSFFSVHDFPALPPRPGLVGALTARPWMARPFLALAKKMTAGWARPVRELRASRGLPDAGHPMFEGQFSPFGTLALFSKVLASPQSDWPVPTTTTGFVFYNRPAPMPAAVDRFLEGDPPIVFTLGSSAVGVPGGFYDESIAAARALRCRALLMIRSDLGSATSAPLPEGVMAVDYAPHEAIFPRAAAIVHHGGVGTLGQALRSGRPMVVVPHAHDQPDNGLRVARLGVARVIDARQYRASAVVRGLDALLNDASCLRRAHDVGEVVRSENGAEAAVDTITDVLGR